MDSAEIGEILSCLETLVYNLLARRRFAGEGVLR